MDVAMKNKEKNMKSLWLFKVECQKPNGILHEIELTIKTGLYSLIWFPTYLTFSKSSVNMYGCESCTIKKSEH